MLRLSAVQSIGTQFTHWPEWNTPTEHVASSPVIASIARTCFAISRMAERPSESRAPGG